MLYRKGAVFLTILVGFIPLPATQTKPCLIFSGDSGTERAVDPDIYSRIHFGDTGMELSNPDNPGDFLELPYSAYCRFRIGDVDANVAVEEIQADDPCIRYDRGRQVLQIVGADDSPYRLCIFGTGGMMVADGTVRGDGQMSVATLVDGVYVAVAVGKDSKELILKFVKR